VVGGAVVVTAAVLLVGATLDDVATGDDADRSPLEQATTATAPSARSQRRTSRS
jgi:hypothetical protein